MSIDTIGNFLTIIRNGVRASLRKVTVPYSRLKQEMCNILKEEGFIHDFILDGEGITKVIVIHLKYIEGESVIHEIKRKSRPGLRQYMGHKKFEPVIGGLGVSIVTTNQGIMTDKRARQLGVGGEVICTVW